MDEKTTKEKAFSGCLLGEIRQLTAGREKPLRLMEVCGTHTVSIFRAGLRQLLPAEVELVSGPGCPVCVTPDGYMDAAIAYAGMEDVIVSTFGDMLKVPGSSSSLAEAMARGGDVRIVYSPLDALTIAKENPDKKVVFLAVGFETTAPTAAAAVLAAERENADNFFLLPAQKLVPPAIRALLSDEDARIDGFILPGHVAVVTGSEYFSFLAEEYHLPGVVAGFSPTELLRGIYRLVRQAAGEARIENEYKSVVRPEGNPAAQEMMARVYETCAAEWRGLGTIPASGLRLRDMYRRFDFSAARPLDLPPAPPKKSGCRCGEVLRGKITPKECKLFGTACVPEHAAGPCMVSAEGVCAAWHKYGGGIFQYG
ncbi:MAG: hydrogenase formation protein HypD [Schwartzia sp.]|nr:hydrogenase formation protein HypD [Schwartzia sp. (in: firmicutes)]